MMANPLRPALLAAGGSPTLERLVSCSMLTRRVVDRFVAGSTEPDAVSAVTGLLASGRRVSVDYLGEDTSDPVQARATVAAYLSLVRAYTDLDAPDGSLEMSVKLSALGQSLPAGGDARALDNAAEICCAAAQSSVLVTVDAEDHTTTDSTLSIVRELRREFPSVGTVLQAYLHRTEQDCHDFSGPGSRIRLCKGAYREPADVAWQDPDDVDASYRRCVRILMAGQGYPMVATHDPAMIEAAAAAATEFGRTPNDMEFQMLYGIRDAEQVRLADLGHRVRVYVPYGEQWYGYFMRRLAERPANLRFFARSLLTRT